MSLLLQINKVIIYVAIVPRIHKYILIVYEKFKEDKNKILELGYNYMLFSFLIF
jgi:hypothetical protein